MPKKNNTFRQRVYCRTILICPIVDDPRPADECLKCDYFVGVDRAYVQCNAPIKKEMNSEEEIPQ